MNFIKIISVIGLLIFLKVIGVGNSMMRISDPLTNKIVIIGAIILAILYGLNQLKQSK